MSYKKTKLIIISILTILCIFFVTSFDRFILSCKLLKGVEAEESIELSDCFPKPYKIIALKSHSTNRYVSCKIGGRGEDGKYENYNKPDADTDAVRITDYEKFELIPCSDGNYALRSVINRKYMTYNFFDGVVFSADFIKDDELVTLIDEGDNVKIKFVNCNKYICVENNHLDVSDIMVEGEWFDRIIVSSNSYNNEEMTILSSSDWFNLDGGSGGYWNIQDELGHGETKTLNNLGYNITLATIDNMEVVLGLKENNDRYDEKYDGIISFQGTGGYGDDEWSDLGSNLTGWGNAKEKLIHEGYYELCKKLHDKEDEVFLISENGSNLSLTYLINEAKHDNAHFTILGHSMGGALAQIYAMFLSVGHKIKTTHITGRTFNPALAIASDFPGKMKEFEKFEDWYNICVSSDSVPNGNVPGSINTYGIHRIGKTIWLYDKEPDVLVFYEGVGKYNNIAKNKHETGADFALYNMLNNIQKELKKYYKSKNETYSDIEDDEIVLDEDYINSQLFEYEVDYMFYPYIAYIKKYIG